MKDLSQFFLVKYPYDTEHAAAIRKKIEEELAQLQLEGLFNFDEKETYNRLNSTKPFVYEQLISEVLIARELKRQNIKFSRPRSGPDFLTELNGQKIWFEVVTPEPHGVPNTWLKRYDKENLFVANSFPSNEILTRWTSVIDAKNEKIKKYIFDGTVGKSDVVILIVNSWLLNTPLTTGAFYGISQFPFALEAVAPVGCKFLMVDRINRSISDISNSYRAEIEKSSGTKLKTGSFLDPSFDVISALWGVELNEVSLIAKSYDSCLIYNPLARNPLPEGILSTNCNYLISENDSIVEISMK